MIARAIHFLLLGLGLGVLHFASLHANVRLYTEERRRTLAALFLAARIGVAVLVWIAFARLGGAVGLISALVGFLFARAVVTARLRRAT